MTGMFQVHPINARLDRITDIAGTHFYLVKGDREAALLDTGVGCGSLDRLIRSLTNLSVKVIITHGHVDHAMGAGAFEDVWISPLDREVYAEHSQTETRLDYIRGSVMPGSMPEAANATANMLEAPKPFDQFHPLHIGDKFDLGGISLEILEGTGHTPGCVTILIPELRTLLLGDACNPFTYLFDSTCSTVADYREMLLRLKVSVEGRYDRVLLCHGPDGQGTVDLIDSVISVCDDILRGETDDMPFRGFHGEPVCIAKAMDFTTFSRIDGGTGNIVYNSARIRSY